MELIYKSGDLFSTLDPVILHGCNAQGVMGSGVAKLIKKKYPLAFTEYLKEHDRHGLLVGDVVWVKCDKLIGNCITQEFYGTDRVQVDYDGLQRCMLNVNVTCKGMNVSMPKIGAGLAGGDWNIIENIIKETLIDCVPTVWVI